MADNGKVIYLISSSSAYDKISIPKISGFLKSKGYTIETKYLNQQISYFGYVNTDQERGKNIINALTDDNVKYLWFVRGGSGVVNIFPYIYKNRKSIKKSKEK
ncbi:MAG: LD-carboxypeptidase [Serratia symbiotica]|nr:LD-carboxypeptidase [Serratia symbiotica]